ncbi:L,D-transpeptidase family protein [Patescibacteria group bacterium]|nr:L,D-transpeptidase family protein [Patescibacteria group bacterium]
MSKNKYIVLALGLLLSFFVFSEAKASRSHDPLVKVFNAQSHVQDAYFKAYHPSFKGGVNVAAGDINGDGEDEIITGAGLGGGPQVRIFDGAGQFEGQSFMAFHPDFRGGIKVAAGDVDADGRDEVIVSQASDGEPWVKVYDCENACVAKSSFLAYDKSFKGGVSIASGDTDGNGKAEIIVGAGESGGPQIRLVDEFGNFVGFSTFAFSKNFRGGTQVAAGDTNADGQDEVIVSQANLGQAWVKVYNATDNVVLSTFLAYPSGHKGGANVAAGDLDNDGRAEIVTGVGDIGGPQVRVFVADGSVFDNGFFAYGEDFRGGVAVAVGHIAGINKIVTGPGKSLVDGRTDLHKYIDINLSDSQIHAYKDGRLVVESLISAGRPGMNTPTGSYSVRRKEVNHWSGSYGLWMPYSLNFTGSYYIHKLPVWPSGYVEGEDHLGINVSHGCVRVSNEAAPLLFDFADVGTPIFIHY